ncbi:Tetratricopeptide helical [Echinococcus multilocularis]|uniref:Outer dynein arm-docking complex subunit 4 n=1 Tax=Echinococcus multilocularis TaxID=6211 RepID=A0A087W2F6_ECHMU|nr:Tetratricopeptide helical [Echinococcus multilocularis]
MGKSYDAVQHFQQLSNSEERYEMYLKNSKEISQLAAEAYRYLRVRSEFWRQQEPMYNRIRKCRKKTSRNVSSRDDLNALQRLVHMLQDISNVQRAGDHVKALQLCAALREDMKVFNPDFAALTEVMADLHAFEAVSNFHLQNYKEARDGFLAQLETCRNGDLQHHIPRCLENLGRAYAKLENYQAAKEVWTERLQYETTGSEKSWLYFELGLCNMELGEYEEAVMNGLVCKKGSERAFDMDWELRACVLIAQAHLALNNLNEAQTYFQNAQYAAYTLNNQKLEELLVVALEKVEAAIEENERKAVEEEYASFANAYYPLNQARRPMLFAIGAQNRGASDEGRHSTVENSPSFSRTHEIGDEDSIDAEEEDWEDLPDYLQSSESTLPRQNRSGQDSNL